MFIIIFASFFSQVWNVSMNLHLQRCFTSHSYSRPGRATCSNWVQKLNISVSPERQGLLV